MVRADGHTHKLLAWLTEQNNIRGRSMEFSVGFARDGGDVVEVTDLLDVTAWPAGMRVIL